MNERGSVSWSDLVLIGRTVGTHGYQGTIKLELNLPFEESDQELQTLFVDIEGSIAPLNIKNLEWGRPHLLSIHGLNSVEEVSEYVRREVYIHSEHPAYLDLNTVDTQEDLVSKEVIDQYDNVIGIVLSVRLGGFQDILEVRRDKSLKAILIPLPQDWIIEINEQAIRLQIPEGLLDL